MAREHRRRGSVTSKGQNYVSSPERPNALRGVPRHLLNGHESFFRGRQSCGSVNPPSSADGMRRRATILLRMSRTGTVVALM